MSPRHQISCTSSRSTSDRTASRAWMLPWMSERTAMRIGRSSPRGYRGLRRPRPPDRSLARFSGRRRRRVLGVLRPVVLGQVLDPLAGLPLGEVVLHGVDQLAHELRRQVHARDDHAGHLLVLDLVVDPGEGDGELVVGVADVREVRVVAGHLRGVEVDVDVPLGPVVLISHRCQYRNLMKIVVLAVGRIKAPYADDVQHYRKLLTGQARVELIEVRDDDQVAKRIPERAYVSLLDSGGQAFPSVVFSRWMEQRRMEGRDVWFVIGGAFGGVEMDRV